MMAKRISTILPELTYEENQIGQYYHGTHVTGIISSTVPETEIIPIAAFENGQAYTSDLIKAIEYAKNREQPL